MITMALMLTAGMLWFLIVFKGCGMGVKKRKIDVKQDEAIKEALDHLNVLKSDATVDGSMAQYAVELENKIKGDVGDDLDTFEEIVAYIGNLETAIVSTLRDERAFVEETFVPKSGDLEPGELAEFIKNTGLVSKNTINGTLEKLKGAVKIVEFEVTQAGGNCGATINKKDIIDLELKYPDGRSEKIIYFDLNDGLFTNIYNHFPNDLVGRTLTLHYISFKNIFIK